MGRLTPDDWKNPKVRIWCRLAHIPMQDESLRSYLSNCLQRLATYEDLNRTPSELAADLAELERYRADEKNGLLVRLPCKVGDTIWKIKMPTVIRDDGTEWTVCTYKGATVEPLEFSLIHLKSIGELYWLTRAEAEEALKGAEG